MLRIRDSLPFPHSNHRDTLVQIDPHCCQPCPPPTPFHPVTLNPGIFPHLELKCQR